MLTTASKSIMIRSYRFAKTNPTSKIYFSRVRSSSFAHSQYNHLNPSKYFFSTNTTLFHSSNNKAHVATITEIDITGSPSYPREVPGPTNTIPSRHKQIRNLQSSTPENPYDILIIGGGATGAGCALDAATREFQSSGGTPLKVACIERGDFGCETSSRSTKLIWAGIRYLATASASLLDLKLFTNPMQTIQEFVGELKMVISCHRERRFMLEKQRHLCNWVPIAIPFSEWVVKPAPFNHKLFSYFPILAPFVLKFYDSLSSFSCPPSYIMGPKKTKDIFPQLRDRAIKYCAVFYEAQHNDARTNLAIAMSAAEHGAHITNYVEMTQILTNCDNTSSNNSSSLSSSSKKAVGIRAKDRMTGETFDIHAKKIIFAGGPFTDHMRKIENEKQTKENPAVSAAAGTHVVLPGYYCPNDMGLLDYNTSDGRFLFFLPWENHTLVGTTDVKCQAESLPHAPEDEVQWLLNECGKYLSNELRVRRSDVLSAWRGWRPLASDPNASDDDAVSRDHVISENPETGIVFIAGGKWTTWREMSEEVVDHVLGENKKGICKTLDVTLFGGENYSPNLAIQLIQKHGMTQDTAHHLAKTYGFNAHTVCNLSNPTHLSWPRFGIPLAPNYPYIDAEVIYACREYACTIEDVLSRRTRLAFLNKDAAVVAIPRIADLMQKELHWSDQTKREQIASAKAYVDTYGGRIPNKHGASMRNATYRDVKDLFDAMDYDENGFLDRAEVGEVAKILGFPLSEEELTQAFWEMDQNGNGRVDLEEFKIWWNNEGATYYHRQLSKQLGIGGKEVRDIKAMGGGAFFG